MVLGLNGAFVLEIMVIGRYLKYELQICETPVYSIVQDFFCIYANK